MEYKNIPAIIITVVITALIIGGGVYWQQQFTLEKLQEEIIKNNNELQKQISDLQNKLNQAAAEKNDLQQQIAKSTEKPARYVKIILPNGGESICLNDDPIIEWESDGVDVVSVRVVKQDSSGSSYYYVGLNAVPATYNEATIPGKGRAIWKVKDIPAGDGYRMEIMSVGSDLKVSDESDSVFSILF